MVSKTETETKTEVEEVEEVLPKQETEGTEGEELTVESHIDDCLTKLNEQIKQIKQVVTICKQLKKEVKSIETKLKKTEDKKKKKKSSSVKKLTGFNNPVSISKELVEFVKSELIPVLTAPIEDEEGAKEKDLQKNEKNRLENKELHEKIDALDLSSDDNKMARTDVTKLLTKYLLFYKQQNPEKKKLINLNGRHGKRFSKLLSDVVDEKGEPETLSFFKMQKYIKHHFFKKSIGGFPEKEGDVQDSLVNKTNQMKKQPALVESEEIKSKNDSPTPMNRTGNNFKRGGLPKRKVVPKRAVAS